MTDFPLFSNAAEEGSVADWSCLVVNWLLAEKQTEGRTSSDVSVAQRCKLLTQKIQDAKLLAKQIVGLEVLLPLGLKQHSGEEWLKSQGRNTAS